MSDHDWERNRFEAWVQTTYVWRKYLGTHRACSLRRNMDGSYWDWRINDRWCAWKAALTWQVVKA